jgi:hypothetical protein
MRWSEQPPHVTGCALHIPRHAPAVAQLFLVRRMLALSMKPKLFAIVVALAFTPGISLADDLYQTWPVSQTEARRRVLHYCLTECEQPAVRHIKSALPYRATFQRAMAGDTKALATIFRNPDYRSGESEGWGAVPGNLCIATGDRRFAAFLRSLPVAERREILDLVLFFMDYPNPVGRADAEHTRFTRWFATQFPRLDAIDRATPHLHNRNA